MEARVGVLRPEIGPRNALALHAEAFVLPARAPVNVALSRTNRACAPLRSYGGASRGFEARRTHTRRLAARDARLDHRRSRAALGNADACSIERRAVAPVGQRRDSHRRRPAGRYAVQAGTRLPVLSDVVVRVAECLHVD